MMRPKTTLFLMLLVLVTAAAGWGADPVFAPFVESHAGGWIDWQEGAIYGIGRGDLERHGGSHALARRASRVIALQSILKMAAGIRVDDQRSLQELGAGPLVIELEALIHFTVQRQVLVDNVPRPYYETLLRAPITGIDGLTGRLVDALQGRPIQRPRDSGRRPPPIEDDSGPWLVLDARRLVRSSPVSPALFPKIVDAAGRLLYDRDRVEPSALVARGMAQYVTMAGSADRLGSAGPPPATRFDRLLAAAPFLAEDSGVRKKRRRYIVKDVSEVQGLARTNLVISEKDARSLREEDASSKILKRCRVIVIVASPMGGVQGRRPGSELLRRPPRSDSGLPLPVESVSCVRPAA